jgi:tRNA threonylcarbamoyladenosine biosynthesis protein TsaE
MTRSERSPRSRNVIERVTRSAEETRALGRRIARTLGPGDVLLLIGELGAGKTPFVQGLAEGLHIDPRRVSSPTFVLIHEHHDGRLPLYHVDAYRVQRAEELLEVGLEEYFEKPGVTVIEWGEKVKSVVPERAIEVRFEILEHDHRRITIIRPDR